MKLGHMGLALLLSTSACKGKATDDKPATGGSGQPAAAMPPPPAKPGTLNLATVPPLGAPDAIEPPSRDIVPGMTIADALAKGATRDSVDYTLTWKKDVLDLWIAKESNLVTMVEATYKKADYTAMAATWGKPNWGDGWKGKNWLASLNGCQTDCTVSFTRSPFVLIGATPQPPLGLATLTPTSTLTDVQSIVGVPLKDRSGVDTGFGLDIGVDPTDDKLGAIVVSSRKGGDDALYADALDKLWGKRIERGDTSVWFSKDNHWAVETGTYGDTLRYTPLQPAVEEMALVRALPAKLWRKPKAAVAAAMREQKDDELQFPATEWSYGGGDNAGASASVSYDDKGVVDQLRVQINASTQNLKQVIGAFEAAWGKPANAKTADGEDQHKLTVDGVPFVIVYDERSIVLTADVPPEPTN